MKKLLLAFTILSLFSSCDNKEKERSASKIKSLKTELKNSHRQIDSLKNNNLKTVETFIDFSKKHREGYVSKEYVSFFLKDELKFATDKEQVIQFLFDHFKLNEWDLDRGIVNSYLIESHSENKETAYDDITSKEGLCAYIISRINRSPQSLEKIISTDTKSFLYSLLQKDNLYKKAGVYTIVKALLYSYQEINNDDLSRIYEIASNEDNDETLAYILKLPSKKAKNLLKNTEDYTVYETWSDEKSRIFLVYTFWARRYNEGNKKFVYTFLSELHKALTEEEIEL